MKQYNRPEIKIISISQKEQLANQFVEDNNTVGVSAPNLWWPNEQ